MKEKFDKKYYNSLNYSDYMSRGDRFIKTSEDIIDVLQKICLINKKSKILDYGCAVGFLIKGFLDNGFKNIYGYDISDFAKEELKKKKLNYLEKIKKSNFDIIICLDVLEHMTDDEIIKAFNKFKSKIMIFRIPVAYKNKNKFYLDISNRDKTHINCKTKKEWKDFLSKNLEFKFFIHINMPNIYDSDGVFCGIGLGE